MYILEYQDDEGNNYRDEYDWSWLEVQAVIKELKKEGFSNFILTQLEER